MVVCGYSAVDIASTDLNQAQPSQQSSIVTEEQTTEYEAIYGVVVCLVAASHHACR